MKPSIYNFIWPAEQQDKVIVFNSMTTALIELDKDCAAVLNKPGFALEELSFGDRLLVAGLKEGGFVLDDEIDELQVLKFNYNRQKYDPGRMGLTIAPTMLCNFACTYCFEQPGEGDRRDGGHSIMPEPVRQELVDFVARAAKNLKSLQVIWYGGEPLLAQDVIVELSEKFISLAAENNIAYSAYMVTNGYLADENRWTVQKLKENRISTIQVTLDGPPEVHNRRRMLKSGRGSTFERILNNIKLLLSQGLAVHLRINVDRSNMENAEELLDILEAENLKDIQNIYLGQVHADTAGCKSVESSCATTEEFTRFSCAFHRTLAHRGFKAGRYPRSAVSCSANYLNAFVIDPDGDMYKCWHEVGNKPLAVGNIAGFDKPRDRQQRMREIRWLTWEPFAYAGCLSCKLVPVCMGGCSYRAMHAGDNQPDCLEWKYGLEDYIKLRCRPTEMNQ
ncbi:MAG TPA: SPASM domain-containing protein [Methylomusa anaerophila]|uniref:radical SAM/SPASM domain-containing protein n=1 Tax=Methylomusa anaerophila TaxID=1930071 RepID=UPI0018D54830|nr:SPASM domain-containing protein [Methylomusa anaerophila]HML88750.1 SPASM domain-containing protein [Methylomusa anaerophila]